MKIMGGEIGVEEEEGDPAHIEAPHADVDLPAGQVDLHGQRMARAVEDPAERPAGDLDLEVVVLLEAVGVDRLAEEPAPVQQSDADHGDTEVRGGLRVVTGQHPEAPRVEGERVVDAELGAEVGEATGQRSPVMSLVPGVVRLEVRVEVGDHVFVELDERIVGFEGLPLLGSHRLEDRQRVR